MHGVLSLYVGFDLRTRDVWQKPSLPIFTSFSSVLLLYTILTHLFVIFAPEYHCILFFRPCVRHSAGSRYVGEEVLH